MWIIIITNRITQNEQQINLTYEGYRVLQQLLPLGDLRSDVGVHSLLQMALSSVLRNSVISETRKIGIFVIQHGFVSASSSVKFCKFNKIVAYKV